MNANPRHHRTLRLVSAGTLAGALLLAAMPVTAQTLTASEQKLEFEVASIKQNKSDDRPNSNFPLGPGGVYNQNGGHFTATAYPLLLYIGFAYKMPNYQLKALQEQVPKWVDTDKFDIVAKAEGNPTKDEMRLMMRALLAERFHMVIRRETRQVPTFALVLVKPGKLGPNIQPHPADDTPCSTAIDMKSDSAPTVAGGYPATCGGLVGVPSSTPGRIKVGARNIAIPILSTALTGVTPYIDRPVVDQTGLTGTYDFTLEFTPEFSGNLPSGTPPDTTGPTFPEALKEQLGLKLDSSKGPLDFLIVDHIDHPTEN